MLQDGLQKLRGNIVQQHDHNMMLKVGADEAHRDVTDEGQNIQIVEGGSTKPYVLARARHESCAGANELSKSSHIHGVSPSARYHLYSTDIYCEIVAKRP